jgi:hypothetical protein
VHDTARACCVMKRLERHDSRGGAERSRRSCFRPQGSVFPRAASLPQWTTTMRAARWPMRARSRRRCRSVPVIDPLTRWSSVAGLSGWPLETALVRRESRCPAGGGERVRLVPSWATGLSVFGDRVSRARHRVVACSRERRPRGRGCLQHERVTPGVRRAHRRPVDARSNVEPEGIPRDVGSSVGSAI